MKTRAVLSGVLVVALLASSSAWAGESWSQLTVSASSSSEVRTTAPWTGEATLYLWSDAFAIGGGIDILEFAFTGTLPVVGLVPLNGVVNAGTVGAPSLIFPTCDDRFGVVVAEVHVVDASGLGGTLCLTDAPATGRDCARFCPQVPGREEWMANYYRGFTSDGSTPCEGLAQSCPNPAAVDATSWGRTKAAYK